MISVYRYQAVGFAKAVSLSEKAFSVRVVSRTYKFCVVINQAKFWPCWKERYSQLNSTHEMFLRTRKIRGNSPIKITVAEDLVSASLFVEAPKVCVLGLDAGV